MASASQEPEVQPARRSRKTLRRRDLEDGWVKSRKWGFASLRSPLLWVGSTIALLLLILVAQGVGRSRAEIVVAKESAAAASPGKAASEPIRPGTILHTVARFLGARKPEDYRGFIRQEDATMPKILSHFEREGVPDWSLTGVVPKIERSGKFAVVTLKGERLPGSRLILEEVDGVWLADWESFVVFQDVPWEQISAAGARVRIRASVSAHASRPGIFVLRDPLRNKTLLASQGKGVGALPLYRDFEERKSGTWILEIEPHPELHGEVVLSDIICEGWVDRGL